MAKDMVKILVGFIVGAMTILVYGNILVRNEERNNLMNKEES